MKEPKKITNNFWEGENDHGVDYAITKFDIDKVGLQYVVDLFNASVDDVKFAHLRSETFSTFEKALEYAAEEEIG